jgi:NADH-quinone oxidoreductase subunit N
MPDMPLSWSSYAPAVAEIYLALAVCVLLMIDVFTSERRSGRIATLTLFALVIGVAVLVAFGRVDSRTTLFGGMFVADPLSFVLKLAGFLFLAVTLLYSRSYLKERGILRGEYYVLTLTALLGIFVVISANSLLTVYIGIELLALSVYAIIAFDRDNPIAAESAIKYFVLSAIASGVLLYGMSMIYGLTGTLALDELSQRFHESPSAGVVLGLAFIVVAVAFKLGTVPFHMWLPDVYHGSPTAVTLFVSTVPQLAYFSLAFRLLTYGLAGTAAEWSQMLTPLAVLTLIVGNVVAIAQTNLKRMLAYSTIGNVGFILLGFVAGTPGGYSAALYYTLVYVLVVLGSFGVILLASRRGFESDELEDFKGLYSRDPLLAIVMLALMFSTAGVPPFVGFWAKLRVLQELWSSHHPALVVIAAGVSVIGVFYYLRIVKLMYFDAPAANLPPTERSPGVRFALGINAAAVIVLGILPAPLLDLCAQLIR